MCGVLVAQSCLTLYNQSVCSAQGSSVHGIFQARTLEWVAISLSKRNYRKKESEVTQLSLTLCDPMDCSLPGSFIHVIFQARVLEWLTISFSSKQLYLQTMEYYSVQKEMSSQATKKHRGKETNAY